LRGRNSSPSRVKNLLFSTLPRWALVPGVISQRLKQPGCETTTHLQLQLRSRKTWIYMSTPPHVLHRDNFTLYLSPPSLAHLTECSQQLSLHQSQLVYKCTKNCEVNLCVHSAIKRTDLGNHTHQFFHNSMVLYELLYMVNHCI
jgi:hypothetical protein